MVIRTVEERRNTWVHAAPLCALCVSSAVTCPCNLTSKTPFYAGTQRIGCVLCSIFAVYIRIFLKIQKAEVFWENFGITLHPSSWGPPDPFLKASRVQHWAWLFSRFCKVYMWHRTNPARIQYSLHKTIIRWVVLHRITKQTNAVMHSSSGMSFPCALPG